MSSWRPRPLGEGLCYHVRVQCNNSEFWFATDKDFLRYTDILQQAKKRLGVLINHFVIMHSHVHLILTTPGPALLDKVMHFINRTYAHDYHTRYSKHGHFWINAYRCSIIDTDEYALTCMRYLDRNPVRAGIVEKPTQWRWGSHAHYAHHRQMDWVTPHPSYLGLARFPQKRRELYQQFVHQIFPADEARQMQFMKKALKLYYKKQ